MNTRSGLPRVVALVLTAGAACAAAFADDLGDKGANDLLITARIETMFLMNGDLNPFKINTSTTDRVVTLTGEVREQVDKDLAGQLAGTVKGVTSVQNDLVVTPEAETSEEHGQWKQKVGDVALNARVRRQLAYNSEVKGAVLDIDVAGPKVTVNGEVDSPERKDRIEQIIGDTTGVGEVESHITVSEKQTSTDKPDDEKGKVEQAVVTVSDEWVEKMVETSIMWNENLGIGQIDVEVEDGVCTLDGAVPSEAQKKLAASIAESTTGVTSVTNNITVSEYAEG